MVRVAFTFDDGPGPITAALLDALADGGGGGRGAWPATFFVLGKSVEEAAWCGDPTRARALVVRAIREGHVVGHHTYSHAQPQEYLGFAADFRRGEAVVRACRRAAGADDAAPVVFRLPYGVRLVERTVVADTGTLNVATLDPRLPVLASLGGTHTHWTADFADWDAKAGDGAGIAEQILAHVDAQARLGLDAVLCLHDGGSGSPRGYERPATLEAVRAVLPALRARGAAPFTVPVSPAP